MEYDFFISHASEDKDQVARPLAEAIKKHGFQVWYDEFTLSLGDSLSESIDRGLANSRWGIVILSHNFFKKNWPRRELRGLVAREVDSGKIILPVWHEITKEDVLKFSPPLADILAANTSSGIDNIVKDIVEVAKSPLATDDPLKKSDQLIALGHEQAAIINAATYFEKLLKDIAISKLSYKYFKKHPIHSYSFGRIFRLLEKKKMIIVNYGDEWFNVDKLIRLRNVAAHHNDSINKVDAEWFIQETRKFMVANDG